MTVGRHPSARRWFLSWAIVLASFIGNTAITSAAPPPTAVAVGKRDPAAGLPGRWQRELDRRKTWLRTHPGKDPAAIVGLLGIVAELHGDLPDGRLAELLESVAADRRRDPLLRSYAGYLRAELHEAAGNLAQARQSYEREGYLLAWQYVGPFDNAGRAGHAARYGPESEPFAAGQTFSGKIAGEPLTWRAYDYSGVPRGAYVSFDEFLRPNEHVVAYATTWVYVPQQRSAALHLGTGGAYKVWVNDRIVGEGEAYRTPDPLQDTHPIVLFSGWNRILVKVAAVEGMWGLYARVSERDGSSIAGLRVEADAHDLTASPGVPRMDHVEARSLRADLERVYRRHPRAGLPLVEFYRWTHPFDAKDTTAIDTARQVDEAVRSARSAWLLAIVDPDPNTSRDALERAVERARRDRKDGRALLAPLLLELAWREASLGLVRNSRALTDEAFRTSRDDALVELVLAERLADDGFPHLALDWVRDVAARYPDSATVQQELASRLAGLGRRDEALTVLDALSHRRDKRSLSAQRIELLLDLGRADAAAQAAAAVALAAPGLPAAHAEVARLEEARGNLEAARLALGRAVALAPLDPDLHTAMGRVLLRSADRRGAVRSFRRSLALKPQQPGLRDLLATLDDSSGRDLLARHGLDLAKIAVERTPPAWKGKDSGILHHRVVVRVLPNGLTERLDHRIVRILDDRGVRSQAVQAIAYDPAESTVDVRRARVRRTDGTIEEIGETRVMALAQAGYRMYYDQREIQVQFRGLRPGDVLEVAFLKRDVATRNKFDEYFGDLVPLQGLEPRKRVDYVLEAPASRPLFFNVPVERKRSKDGKTVTYRHTTTEVPGVKPEPRMPGWTEVAHYLHVSTYGTWDDVGRWYWDLVREQLVVDGSIRDGVRAALAGVGGKASVAAKVDAIYRHVVRNTRYVGLEFGIHGYKPYRTTDVYARRFGDCKDKASLLKVMLAEAGIASHLVLVRTSDQGRVATQPASLAVFNHAIVYVPELDLFLDGTAEWSGPSELPPNDQGATVLIVRDGLSADLRVTPFTRAQDNVRRAAQLIDLEPDGRATIRHDGTVSGADASSLRFMLQSEDERNERLTKLWGDVFPGAELDEANASVEDILRPAHMTMRLRIPGFARVEGDRLRFPVLGRSSNLAQSMAAQAARTHDLVLGTPSTALDEIEYRLPRGFRFAQLPASRTIESSVGRFVLEVTGGGSRAKVKSRLELLQPRINPAQYGELRTFLRNVDASLEQTFEVEPER